MARSGGLSNMASSATDIATTSPTCTKSPNLPLFKISRGPVGQSVATTGIPSANASASTFGQPSARDDKANTSARAIHGHGGDTNPGRSTASDMPTPSTNASSSERDGP